MSTLLLQEQGKYKELVAQNPLEGEANNFSAYQNK